MDLFLEMQRYRQECAQENLPIDHWQMNQEAVNWLRLNLKITDALDAPILERPVFGIPIKLTKLYPENDPIVLPGFDSKLLAGLVYGKKDGKLVKVEVPRKYRASENHKRHVTPASMFRSTQAD